MELLLLRNQKYPTHTIGQMYVDGNYFCFVLEDVVREVKGQPVEKWKVPNETAIPEPLSKYKVVLENSPRFGPDTLTVLNVPGFAGIRMHSGNTDKDTEGCLILGYKKDPKTGLIIPGTTKPAVLDLKGLVKRAVGDVWLTIKTVF